METPSISFNLSGLICEKQPHTITIAFGLFFIVCLITFKDLESLLGDYKISTPDVFSKLGRLNVAFSATVPAQSSFFIFNFLQIFAQSTAI